MTKVTSVIDEDMLDPYANEIHHSPKSSKSLKGKTTKVMAGKAPAKKKRKEGLKQI